MTSGGHQSVVRLYTDKMIKCLGVSERGSPALHSMYSEV